MLGFWIIVLSTFVLGADYTYSPTQGSLGSIGIGEREFEITFGIFENANLNLTLSLNNVPEGIIVSIEPNNFVRLNPDVIGNIGNPKRTIKISIDKDVEPKTHSFNLVMTPTQGFETRLMNINFNVREEKTALLVENKINRTIEGKTGEVSDGGFISFRNTGNTALTITPVISGNASSILTMSEMTIRRGETLPMFLNIQTPLSQKLGVYDYSIDFFIGSNKIRNMNGTLEISDSVPPRIRSVEFQHDMLEVDNTLFVEATDNIGVERVVFSYDNKDFQLEKKEGDWFELEHSFDRLSRYLMQICAFDSDDNKHCLEFNKTFNKVKYIDVSEFKIKLPSVRINRYSKYNVFNITDDIRDSIKISLSDIIAHTDGTSTSDLTIRMIDGDETTRRFRSINDEVLLERSGEIFFEITSSKVGEFSGNIDFILPDFMEEIDSIEFEVDFRNYEIPMPFNMDWYGREIKCDVIDTGDYDTSFIECPFKFDLSVNKENLPMPTTLKDKENADILHNQTIQEYRQSRNAYRMALGILIALLLIITIASIFMIKIYPYIRINHNVNDKEK